MLVALLNAVPFADPVISEIVRQVESLHIREAEIVQPLECGADIRAVTPWAAAAIENNQLAFLQRLDFTC